MGTNISLNEIIDLLAVFFFQIVGSYIWQNCHILPSWPRLKSVALALPGGSQKYKLLNNYNSYLHEKLQGYR